MTDKVYMIIEGDFGGNQNGNLDFGKIMDTFHDKGIEVHSYNDGVYEAVICNG